MTADPMTADQFRWFLTLVTGGVSALWFLSDARKLIRTGRDDGADPSVRDRRFGYTMGLVIATIGIVGSAKLNHWISFGSAAEAPAPTAAVMFDPKETRKIVQDFAGGAVTVLALSPSTDVAAAVSAATQIDPDVVAADVSVMTECTFHHGGTTLTGILKGVTPRRLKNVIEKYFVQGSLQADSASEPTIALGGPLADALGVKLGDTIDVAVPPSPARSVRVTALHNSLMTEYDLRLAVMNLATARALIGTAGSAPSVEIELRHDDKALHIARALQAKLGSAYQVMDWCELNQKYFGCTWQPSAD